MTTAVRRQQGFSLVELMVAMVIALVLLGGLLQVVLTSREGFDAQRATAGLQDNLRLASYVLDNVIGHAGFRVLQEGDARQLFTAMAGGSGPSMAGGAVIAASANTRGASDMIRVRFQADGAINGCRQAVGAPGAAAIAVIDFYVSNNDRLLCRHNGDTFGVIAENVERFELSFGLDMDDVPGVDRYVSTLTTADTDRVISVRFQLLVRSAADEPFYPAPRQQTFRFVGDSDDVRFSDRSARRLLDQTVALRNRLP